VFEELEAGYGGLLHYSGFETAVRAAKRLEAAAADEVPRDLWIAAMTSYVRYVNRLDAWSHHYFPWYLGEQFTTDPTDEPITPPAATGGTLSCEGPRIRLTWEPLGITVHATLAANLNPELVEEVLAEVPFRVSQEHAVMAGESMFAWTPAVSLAPVRVRERVCDAPAGRLRFQQASGQKLVVAYGPTSETVNAPVLGVVDAGDVGLLPRVGAAVAESTFSTKDLIWLEVARA
jgi:hypothetical protein